MKVTTDACLLGAWAASLSSSQNPEHILDIGTGTGLLTLMLAQKIPASQFHSIEKDPGAAAQAKDNAAASAWRDNVHIFSADAKDFQYPVQYNIIISNPPFYENELKGNDRGKNIAHHNEGLLLTELLPVIYKNLAPGGRFFLLLPFKRDNEVQQLFIEQGLHIKQAVYVRQSVHHNFFRILLEGERFTGINTKTSATEIAITDDNKKYTPEFTELLKDYYLYL